MRHKTRHGRLGGGSILVLLPFMWPFLILGAIAQLLTRMRK